MEFGHFLAITGFPSRSHRAGVSATQFPILPRGGTVNDPDRRQRRPTCRPGGIRPLPGRYARDTGSTPARRVADLWTFVVDDALGIEAALGRVLPLARSVGVTSYDASYLDLATRRGIPLATSDDQLARAARAAGIELVDT